ncbi:gap-Pol polyprotein, partial [Clonorchis sinensis]
GYEAVQDGRMEPGCDPTVFFASLRQSLDRALPGLDGASRHRLISDQFVEGVQPALGAQLRLARATGQLSVEELVHLARELAEAPLATFQSQENRRDSTVEDLKNKVDQPTEQLAAVKTESRRHARTSRCYKCGTPGHWRSQCPRTRPLVHNKILEYYSFAEWAAISSLIQTTIQAVIEIEGKRELFLIIRGAEVSLGRRGNQAERRPCALAVRAVGEYRLKIDGLSMHAIRLGNKSVQHTFLTSPDIEQTILGADFLKSTDSVIDLKQGKLMTSYGVVKLEGYPSTANAFDLTAPVRCPSIYGRRSIKNKRHMDFPEPGIFSGNRKLIVTVAYAFNCLIIKRVSVCRANIGKALTNSRYSCVKEIGDPNCISSLLNKTTTSL